MEPLTLYAPAKVNLTLTVGDRRPDGYHDVSTVMQAVGLYDTLILTHGGAGLTLTCTDPAVPSDATNLVLRAAGRFFEETKLPVPDLHLHLRKRIPSQAGLGGGSSDAASTLLALRTLYAPSLPDVQLEHMAAALGSDVPFFIRGGTALARGRGERLTPMPRLRDGWFVIVKPPEGFSTPPCTAVWTTCRRSCPAPTPCPPRWRRRISALWPPRSITASNAPSHRTAPYGTSRAPSAPTAHWPPCSAAAAAPCSACSPARTPPAPPPRPCGSAGP